MHIRRIRRSKVKQRSSKLRKPDKKEDLQEGGRGKSYRKKYKDAQTNLINAHETDKKEEKRRAVQN